MSRLFKCCFGNSGKKSLKSELKSIEYKDTQLYIPEIKYGKVIKVYDGDTITIASRLPYKTSPYYRFSIRLQGIDCPELRTDNYIEKEVADIAKQYVHNLVYGKIVTLENCKIEKYGRILADVIYKKKSISDMLLKARLAVPYDGKSKISPSNWMQYYHYGYL